MPTSGGEVLCACKQRLLAAASVDALQPPNHPDDAAAPDDPLPWPMTFAHMDDEYLARLTHAVRDLQNRVAFLECERTGHQPVELSQ